jgi:hypothetical protein
MKQLKVIANQYDNVTGLIQVNYNQEIIIEPGSEISMDKFNMEVTNGLTDNFEVPNQTVYINTNVLDTRVTSRAAIVPANTYLNMGALLAQLNESYNGILDSDMITSANVNQSNTPDNGLFFRTWVDATSKNIAVGFGSSAISSKSNVQGSGGIERIRALPSSEPTFAVTIAAACAPAGAV